MTKKLSSLAAALAIGVASWAQAMSGAPLPMSGYSNGVQGGDASGMMAPPTVLDDSGPAMMSSVMSYDELKSSGRLADVARGAMLRTGPSTGRKLLYSTLTAAEAIASKGPAILFFAADWCPSCQADLRDINTNGSSLGNITVIVVDYDKSAELKARYGIGIQDSFVRIDAMGSRLVAWNGGGVAGILAHVKQGM
ncbi:MAG TPA: thioredoxin family protein [Rectinemataceae bacterium]|nr:thioredoxin family protein [Rectinemataceae bacterium]